MAYDHFHLTLRFAPELCLQYLGFECLRKEKKKNENKLKLVPSDWNSFGSVKNSSGSKLFQNLILQE